MEHQEDVIRAYCETHGLELVELLVDDGTSAYKQPLGRRSAGRRVVELVRRGEVGAVVALRLDRLFRNMADAIVSVPAWDKLGVSVQLLDFGGIPVDTSTPMGRIMLMLMAGFAEMESYAKSERAKDCWAFKRARGERLGGSAPYGYRMEGTRPVPREDEQRGLELILTMKAGGASVASIVDALKDIGAPPRGKAWYANTIYRILERAA
jgi:DNA invertase Pin-like site-specific DNA recombinase